MKIDKSTMVEEAVVRMRKLGIYEETVRQFRDEGLVSISEPPLGAFYWAEGEDLERIHQFEAEQNALVYTVIRSYTTFGKMDSYLFVGKDQSEWEEDCEGIVPVGTSEMFAYVYNHDMVDCSEFGYIGVDRTIAGGLKRVW